MSQTLRQPEILETARRVGKVTVDGLADKFGVTQQTIRRDLSELADAGRLERVHGGAVLPSGTSNIEYHERRHLNEDAKMRIACQCAKHIPQGASVFLNIGTTTEAVAKELLQHRGLLVVTNNMNIAQTLSANPDCEIILTGGTLRRIDAGLVGPQAIETIQQFKFDFAVIGCSALDQDGDLLDFDLQEVTVSRTILKQARKTFLVADQSKFQRKAPARIASMAQVNTVYTDVAIAPPLSEQCSAWNTQVVIASRA